MAALRSRIRHEIDTLLPGIGRYYRLARDRRWAASPPVRTPEGFALVGPPGQRSPSWEMEERLVLDREIMAADVVVDVGANIGFYACLACSRGKHVIAVEPLPQNLRYLYRNLSINSFDDVEVFPMGLASRPGVSDIHGFADIASFVPDWSQAASVHSQRVSVTTLDTLIGNRFDGQQLLIKVDVEGFENEVLAGATETLAHSPKPRWVVEIIHTNPLTGRVNLDFARTFSVFAAAGYRGYRISAGLIEMTAAAIASAEGADDSGFNFLFVDAASE